MHVQGISTGVPTQDRNWTDESINVKANYLQSRTKPSPIAVSLLERPNRFNKKQISRNRSRSHDVFHALRAFISLFCALQ